MFGGFVERDRLGTRVKVRLSAGRRGPRASALSLLDTEEKRQIQADKPKTRAGELATNSPRCSSPGGRMRWRSEFDTTGSALRNAFVRHRAIMTALICLVWTRRHNYNLEGPSAAATAPISSVMAVRASYHREVCRGRGRGDGRRRWWYLGSVTNAGGRSRDYANPAAVGGHARPTRFDDLFALGRWRAASCRCAWTTGCWRAGARDGRDIVGLRRPPGRRSTAVPTRGAVIFAGSRRTPSNLWVPNAGTATSAEVIVRLVNLALCRAGGRAYVYVPGARTSLYATAPRLSMLTEATPTVRISGEARRTACGTSVPPSDAPHDGRRARRYRLGWPPLCI